MITIIAGIPAKVLNHFNLLVFYCKEFHPGIDAQIFAKSSSNFGHGNFSGQNLDQEKGLEWGDPSEYKPDTFWTFFWLNHTSLNFKYFTYRCGDASYKSTTVMGVQLW